MSRYREILEILQTAAPDIDWDLEVDSVSANGQQVHRWSAYTPDELDWLSLFELSRHFTGINVGAIERVGWDTLYLVWDE